MDADSDERVRGMNRSIIGEILGTETPPESHGADWLREFMAQLDARPKAAQPPGAQPKPPELVKDAATRPEAGAGLESFDPDSADYKAFGWAGNVTVPSLIIILKDGSECGVNYHDLASAYPGGSMFLPSAPGCKGNVIRLLVVGADGLFLVVIEGLRLRRLWELIMGHKTPWIHELPAGVDFTGSADPVIWSIAFKPVRAAAGGR